MSLLTPQQVAEQLQVSRNLVASLVNSGQLVAVRVGKRYRFRQEDVQAFVQRQLVENQPTGGNEKPKRRRPASDAIAKLRGMGMKI